MTDFANLDKNFGRSWLQEVSLGNVSNAKHVRIFGFSESVGTTYMTLWDSADFLSDFQDLRDTPAVLKISSEASTDDFGSTGATVVAIVGLDSDGEEQTENVVMDGQTAVNTVNTYSAINGMRVVAVGSKGDNQGNIWAGTGTITSGVPEFKMSLMLRSYNVSHTPVYTVPAGKVLMPISGNMSSADTDKAITIRTCLKEEDLPKYYPIVRTVAGGASFSDEIRTPATLIPAGATIAIEVKADTGTGAAAVAVGEFVLLDEE